MDLFSVIEDATAIVRLPKGVHKQVKMYSRGDRVFVPHGGGYIRVTAPFSGTYGTSHPDVKVIEFEAAGVDVSNSEPRFRPSPVRRAA